VIKATHIFKSYNNIPVLKGVSVEIPSGKIISIVGSSGAGKTTLLQILGTLDTPTDRKKNNSSLVINEVSIYDLSDKKLSKFRNEHIGFIFQFHQLLPEFTALENVCIPALIAKKSKKDAEKRAKELLSYLGLSDRINHKPNELSGGEQQRVAVARALINNPSVIYADEPSGNLDSANAEELHQLFLDIREKFNTTFVIVTHNENLANLADIKYTMKDGLIL
jgi:lipoprotein-releasing system ATP-binding protein